MAHADLVKDVFTNMNCHNKEYVGTFRKVDAGMENNAGALSIPTSLRCI